MTFDEIMKPEHLADTPIEELKEQLASIDVSMPEDRLKEAIDNAILNVKKIVPPPRRSRYRSHRHDPEGRDLRRYGYARRRSSVVAPLAKAEAPAIPESEPIEHENSYMRATTPLESTEQEAATEPAVEVPPLPPKDLTFEKTMEEAESTVEETIEQAEADIEEAAMEKDKYVQALSALDQVQDMAVHGVSDDGEEEPSGVFKALD
jgi:hypothetical protein